MKKITILLVSLILTTTLFAEDFINGSFYIKTASNDMTFNFVSPTKTITNKLVVGRTYESDKDLFELFTVKNKNTSLHFSSGLLTQLESDSQFNVNSFSQSISDKTAEPELLTLKDFMLNISLINGSAYFIAPKYTSPNTMCVLQTSLMNLELNGGKYYIKSNPKYVIVYVIEGTVGIFDNQTNKKDIKKSGSMVLIFPSPMKATETLITEKPIERKELEKFTENIKELESNTNSITFVVFEGRIFGFKK